MSTKEQLDSLHEIRDLMKRSTKFIALNGWSGVLVGLTALVGVAIFCNHFHLHFWHGLNNMAEMYQSFTPLEITFILRLGLGVFIVSVLFAVVINSLEAKKTGHRAWDHTSKRLAFHLGFPLLVGVFFCLFLVPYEPLILPGASMVFYGLALINASKYTIDGIKWLGVVECILGLFCMVFMYDAIFYWSLGFGVMHILAGLVFQYTKKSSANTRLQ